MTTIGKKNVFSNYPNLRTIVIPESVTSINGSAFSGCRSLTSVTIPESVTFIGDCTFQNCTSLTSVTIPNSVTSISYYAFGDCTSLKTINYTGTEEQWNAIRKHATWKSGTAANVIYNYKPE